MVGMSQSQWPATSMRSRVSRFGDATMGSCEKILQTRSAAVCRATKAAAVSRVRRPFSSAWP